MTSNIGLIFLGTLTVGIFFGNGASFKITKQYLSKINMENVPKNISDLVDLITLNETLTFWNESKFHECFNKESVDFNLAVHDFVQELGKCIKNFKSMVNDENGLVQLCYNMVNENYRLIEEARNGIYLETQSPETVEKRLNEILPPIIKGLITNFMGLEKCFPEIQNTARTNEQKKMWEEIQKNYETKVKNIKEESIKFIRDTKTCMNI